MKENKMIVIFGSMAVLIILLMVIFRGPDTAKKDTTPTTQVIPENIQPFHPERVREFRWGTKTKNFTFHRSKAGELWSPQTEIGEVNSRIQALGMTRHTSMTLTKPALVNVKVVLDDGTTLQGGWDGNIFVWTSGALNGKGFQTLGEAKELFQAGTYAFESKKISWCPARIGMIASEGGGPTFKLSNDESGWTMERGNGRGNADGTYLENWFGRHCEIQVDQYVDPELYGGPLQFEQKINVTFKDKKSGLISRLLNAPVFKMGNQVFVSRTFSAGITDLMAAPFSGDGTRAPSKVQSPTTPAKAQTPAAKPKAAVKKKKNS